MEASGKPKQREETSAPFAFSDDEGKKAAEKAMSLLLHKDRTRWELTERLARAGCSEKASLEAIGYVDQFGYINDQRYVENYIMFQKGKKSKKEMIYRLTEKGIPNELISQTLENMEYEGEEGAIQKLVAKKLRGREFCELDYRERQKIAQYLGRKGYHFPTIKKVLSQFES